MLNINKKNNKHIYDDESRLSRLIWDLNRQKQQIKSHNLVDWEHDGMYYLWGYLWNCEWTNHDTQQLQQSIIRNDSQRHPLIINRLGVSNNFMDESVAELRNIIKHTINSMLFRASAFNNGANDRHVNITLATWKWAGQQLMNQLGYDTSDWIQNGMSNFA